MKRLLLRVMRRGDMARLQTLVRSKDETAAVARDETVILPGFHAVGSPPFSLVERRFAEKAFLNVWH